MGLIVTFEGHEFSFDKNAINIDEWRELKRKYKMTPKQFDETIGQADPDASTFLYWVMLRQSGDQRVPLGDALKPDIIALNNALAAALSAEPDPEPEADPTAAGSLPATTPSDGSGPATLSSSGPSISSVSPATADSTLAMSGG